MPRSYSTTGLILPADSEDVGVWGQLTNINMNILTRLTSAVGTVTLSGTTTALGLADGVLSDGHYAVLVLTGSPSGTNTITLSPSDAERVFHVLNTTSEDAVLTQGSGGDATIPAGQYAICYCDGAGATARARNLTVAGELPTSVSNRFDGTTAVSGIDINSGSIDGTPVGANSASTGAFTTLSVSGAATFNDTVTGDLAVTGAATVGAGLAVTGAIDSSGLTVTGDFTLTSTAPTVTVSDTTRDLSLALFTRDGFSGRDDVVLELGGTAVDGFSRVVVRSDGVDCALFSALAQTGVIQTDNLLATSQISGATVTGDMIATQAEAEAGTASNKIMTPERTADAISAQAISPVKAWANFYWDGASVVIRESLNVSSIVRDSTGVFTVTFSSALTDANYAAAGSFSVGDNSTGVLNDGAIKFYNLAAGSMKTSMFDGNGGARDPSYTAQFIVVR